MRRLLLLGPLLAVLAGPVAPAGAAGHAAPALTRPTAVVPTLAAFRSRFGGGFGRSRYSSPRYSSPRYSSRGRGVFGGRARSRGLLHRIARALAFAYILNLFFSHGGLSFLLWIVVIALVVRFVHRRRRRRLAY
jgi:uncharacterized membrane protein